jgi:hypothetical protein
MRENIEVGFQAFISDGGEEFGAVRAIAPGGRSELGSTSRTLVTSQSRSTPQNPCIREKVIFNCAKLGHRLRRAIGHAHDAEKPGF